MDKALIWLRRDLRLNDHSPLYRAVNDGYAIQHAFVFDTSILNPLPRNDRRVTFIHESLQCIEETLNIHNAQLKVFVGDPIAELSAYCGTHDIKAVYCALDYEPYAIERDAKMKIELAKINVKLVQNHDQCVRMPTSVLQNTGKPYTVFTPYFNKWNATLSQLDLFDFTIPLGTITWWTTKPNIRPTLATLGFVEGNNKSIGLTAGFTHAQKLWADFKTRITQYHELRDFPARKGPSYLSVHFRFGTLSPRQCVREVHHLMTDPGVLTWIKELGWRDFYFNILTHFPNVVNEEFKANARAIKWEKNALNETAWQTGQTGYPIIDAAVRQLLNTGYMHNRLRMVVASFVTKHLGLDWRTGEAFFAVHLNDFELSSNNGGWQWAASTGCDAQPYFRIFNPLAQSTKFDPDGLFIKRYCPELKNVPKEHIHTPWLMTIEQQRQYHVTLGSTYPLPMVDHATARLEALARFKTES